MANVQPFAALRYDPARAADWAALLGPPYDIVDAEQAAALKAANPHQITHIETASTAEEIAAAARRLSEWRESGVLIQDETASFYLHEQRIQTADGPRTRRTVFGAVELSEWGAGGVMAHERTMPGPKAARTTLRSVAGADISPLMAFAPDPDDRIGALIDDALRLAPLSEGVDAAGDSHTLRRISDPALAQQFSAAFAQRRIYMADGHHRYESALASRDQRPASHWVLMGIVRDSDDGLAVGATHRLIHADLPSDFTDGLARSFSAADASAAALGALEPGSLQLGLITAQGASLLEPAAAAQAAMPASVPAAWRTLPPAILQYAILEPLLGIGDAELAAGGAVSYTHYLSEADEAVRAGRAQAAFILPAATLQDVIETADAGSFMPQKSTYFVPKLPTGLVLHPLD